MDILLILISIGALSVFILIIALFKRYKRCPSDKILVVYGKVGKGAGTESRTAKCIHGGAAFIIPVIQDFQFLDLTPIPIEVDLRNALSRQNIRVSVPSRFMVGISTEQGIMDNAAERLLGLSMEQIQHLAADIIFGQLRVVIATMDIEEINSDREKFLTNVYASVEHELIKIGLKLINVNITDITDESGYISALGQAAAAEAVNNAKRAVAEKNRDGSIGEASAHQEQRTKVAALMAEAKIGEANAMQNERTQTAKANATAVEGENRAKIQVANSDAQKIAGEAEAKQVERVAIARANSTAVQGENASNIEIANSNAVRREQEAEAERKAVAAEKINVAKALEEAYMAEKEAEMNRAERDKASQHANIIVPAEISKQRLEIEAEAEAERIRRIAKGNADSTFFRMQAEANGLFEILTKQAQGYQQLVGAAGGAKDAVMMMISDKLVDLTKIQVEAIKNIKIDKVTVWDSLSSGKDGNSSSTANFLSGMLGSLPPYNEMFKMAGMELPSYLKGVSTENPKIEEAKIVEEKK